MMLSLFSLENLNESYTVCMVELVVEAAISLFISVTEIIELD